MQQEVHVIPESPKEPAGNIKPACTDHADGPGQTSASPPPQNVQNISFIKHSVAGSDGPVDPHIMAQPEAQQVSPLPAASNSGILSDRQPLHLDGCSVPFGATARQETEVTGFQVVEIAHQPEEFDIVVDAHPAGKLTLRLCFTCHLAPHRKDSSTLGAPHFPYVCKRRSPRLLQGEMSQQGPLPLQAPMPLALITSFHRVLPKRRTHLTVCLTLLSCCLHSLTL